jgi:hypothetical protein
MLIWGTPTTGVGGVVGTIGSLLTKGAIAGLKLVMPKVVKTVEQYLLIGSGAAIFQGYNIATEPRPVRDQATFISADGAFNAIKIDLSQFKPQVFGPRASARAIWLWP